MIRLRPLAVLVLVSLLAGCGQKDGRKQLLVYSAHGPDILLHFEQEFERAHKDVDVTTLYLGAYDLLERVRAEKSNPQAAVWWGADSTTFDVAAREGLLDAYRPTYADDRLPR